jgi:hypothetical protein
MLSTATLADTSCQSRIEKPSWPDWTGETVVCMATGPSLTSEQVDVVRNAKVRTIAINDLGLSSRNPSASWCDIWYAADQTFWLEPAYEMQARASHALKVCAEDASCRTKNLLAVVDLFLQTNDDAKALQFIQGFAVSGGHGGYQCLQLAMSLGASRVLLIGYDCKPNGEQTNYFGRKPQHLHKASPYKAWVESYQNLVLREGSTVINCTPGSAIKAYPFADIRECL